MMPIFAALLFSVQADTKKVRGVWLDASQCPDEATTAQVIKTMSENGVNRIYSASWKQGHVFFDSATMRAAIGADGIGRMIIPWAVKYGHRYGISVYAWFEYGYIASYNNLLTPFGQYANGKGWIMGEVNHMFYMDPRSNATEFLADIMKDVITTGVDGLQMDDHFSCRKKFAQCKPSVISSAAFRLHNSIRKVNQTIPVSLAPAPMPEAYTEYSVNWPALMTARLFDEVVPLLYTSSANYYKKMLVTNEAHMPREVRKATLMGVMANAESADKVTAWKELKEMMAMTVNHSYGVVVWYGKALVKDYRQEFHELWGSKAAQ